MLHSGTLVSSASERGGMLNRYVHVHHEGKDEQQGSVGMKEGKSALGDDQTCQASGYIDLAFRPV